MTWHSVGWAPDTEIEVAVNFASTIWVDITDDVIRFSTGWQRSGRDPLWPAAQLTLELNNSTNRYSPSNTSGTHYGYLIPGKPIRVRVRRGGSTIYDLFFGLVDDWACAPVFVAQSVSGGFEVTTVRAYQATSMLASWRQSPTDPEGEGETAAARVDRILTEVGWSYGSDLSGFSPVQGITWNADALSLLRATVKAEGGYAWVDGAGEFVMRNRHYIATSTCTTAQATFGNGGGQIPYLTGPSISSGVSLVSNRVFRGNVGQTSAAYEDLTQIPQLLVDSDTSLIGADRARTIGLAERELLVHARAIEHVESLQVRPQSSTAWAAMLSLPPMARVDVVLYRANGSSVTIPSWVLGLSHTAEPGSWTCGLSLMPIRDQVLTTWGTWGTGQWGTFQWAW